MTPPGTGAPVRVCAVLVTWNGRGWLPSVIASLRAQRDVDLHVVVSDNGSDDGSPEWLEREAPEVVLVRNGRNLGFAGANNRGIAHCDAPYVALVNLDVELAPDYLARLVAALEADPGAGSASGRLLRPGPAPALVDSTGHDVYRSGWAGNRLEEQVDPQTWDGIEEVFGVCAAAAVYRRSALADVASPDGILAEPFFAYIEDVDLDWRLRWRGWRALHVPGAVAVHHRSGTGARFTPAVRRHILKNRLLLVVREYDRAWLLRDLPAIAALTATKTVDFALDSPSAVLGLGDFVRELPAALRARRVIMATRTVTPSQLRPWMLPFPWLGKLRSRWRRVARRGAA